MEKLMEPVSRLDVIKAFTLMDDPRDLKVIHIRNNKWSEDNSGQIDVITRSVAIRGLSRSKIDSVEICKIDSREGIKYSHLDIMYAHSVKYLFAVSIQLKLHTNYVE